MAEEYWESTPFGKDSYFAPGWDEKQKEERQNNNKSLKSTTHNSGKVYLTFDDGLQLGTRDVLDVLKENNVKATFFLTGIHVKSFIEKIDMDQGLDMLKEIYQKHLIETIATHMLTTSMKIIIKMVLRLVLNLMDLLYSGLYWRILS